MKYKGIILWLLLWCSIWAWSQDMIVIIDDSQSLDTLPTIDTIAASTPVVQVPTSDDPVRYWSDVRMVRDSLKQTIRSVRDSLKGDIRSMRDSVRSDLLQIAKEHPHELRIGWGDQMFEALVWFEQPYYTLYPADYIGEYNENYRYTQHWFLEYQYRIRHWFNFGVMADYSGVLWDKVRRNGKGELLSQEENCSFHNISVLLTLRFTYMHTKYMMMYSGLGAGLNINTGTEIDYWGRQTAMAPALNLTVLGMSVGNERWFGAIEFGGLYSLMNTNEIYLAGSRMFTASVGVRL